MNHDLTRGNLLKTMVSFSLPFLLSYFLQTLYGMADLYIIGQFNGVAYTTAVANGSQIMHMVTVIIVGLAMGSTVLIGRAMGAGKQAESGQLVGNTIVLFGGLSVVFAGLLLLLTYPLIALVSVPAEAVALTAVYLRICFIGIPCITAYNIISAIFRGLGDSKSPMYFVMVSCVCNIALDYLFIGAFHLGAAGAALGTTLSQAVSVLLALFVVSRRSSGLKLKKTDFVLRKPLLKELLHIGIPVALQDGFIQVSFLLITVMVNRRGLNDAAAVGVVEKFISFIFLVPSTLLSTVSALGAQNIGAGRHDRVRSLLRYAILFSVLYGLTIGLLMQFEAETVLSLFTKDSDVIRLGAGYMHSYVWDCLFAGIHFSFSGFFCAYGHSGLSFLHNSISICCVRIPIARFCSVNFPDTLFPMGFASTFGSMISVIVCVIALMWLKKRHSELFNSIPQ